VDFGSDGGSDEQGRVAASQRFISASKSLLSDGQYARLVGLLVQFDNDEIDIKIFVAEVMGLLKHFPQLQIGFRPFMSLHGASAPDM
jgi:hypothetical protein